MQNIHQSINIYVNEFRGFFQLYIELIIDLAFQILFFNKSELLRRMLYLAERTLTRTLCVSSCVSPLTELLPLLVPIPRSLRSFASSSLYTAKLMLSLRPLLPRSSIISEKVLFRRRCRSCSSSSSFFTSTTRSIMCSCRFLRLLFQLSKFCEHDNGYLYY